MQSKYVVYAVLLDNAARLVNVSKSFKTEAARAAWIMKQTKTRRLYKAQYAVEA